MYDIIDATMEFLNEKGLITDRSKAAHELYGSDTDGSHIIGEEVQNRLKDEVEHDMVLGMMEEPEYGVQAPRRGGRRR